LLHRFAFVLLAPGRVMMIAEEPAKPPVSATGDFRSLLN